MNSIRKIAELNERELEAGIGPSGSWHTDYRDTAFIYFGGIHPDLSEGDVLIIFSQFGEPVYINLVRDRETGKSKGFGFLKYQDQRSTDLAVDNLNGATILDRVLRVDHTRYKPKDGEVIRDNTHGEDLEQDDSDHPQGRIHPPAERDDRRRKDAHSRPSRRRYRSESEDSRSGPDSRARARPSRRSRSSSASSASYSYSSASAFSQSPSSTSPRSSPGLSSRSLSPAPVTRSSRRREQRRSRSRSRSSDRRVNEKTDRRRRVRESSPGRVHRGRGARDYSERRGRGGSSDGTDGDYRHDHRGRKSGPSHTTSTKRSVADRATSSDREDPDRGHGSKRLRATEQSQDQDRYRNRHRGRDRARSRDRSRGQDQYRDRDRDLDRYKDRYRDELRTRRDRRDRD